MSTRASAAAASVCALEWTVVGAGSIGRRHLRNLRALGAASAGVLRRSDEPLTGDLSGVRVHTELPAAGGDRSAAVICTPTGNHAGDAAAAMAAGYHVLIEKPLASTLDGAAVIRDAASHHGKLVMVASCLRFHPIVQELKRSVVSGALGDIHWMALWCGQHLAEWRPQRRMDEAYSARRADGGGVLLDLIHEIDYLHWICGDAEVTSASVGSGARLGIDAEDTADLLLKLAGGGVATCHLDYLARPAMRGGRLAAAGGRACWDLIVPTLDLWTEARPVWHRSTVPDGWSIDRMYGDELIAFADYVLGETENPSPLGEAERALRTALDARQAGERRA